MKPFYLITTPSLIWEQTPHATLADAAEQCWNVEEADMRALHIDPARGTVVDVTDAVACLMGQTTLERQIDAPRWLADFLDRFRVEYHVEDRASPSAMRSARLLRDPRSTLNHHQQGI